MPDNKKVRIIDDIYPLLILVLSIIVGYVYVTNNHFYSYLTGGLGEKEIVDRSNTIMTDLGYDLADFDLKISKTPSQNLLKFVQRENMVFADAASFPIYYWRMNYVYKDPIKTERDDDINVTIGGSSFFNPGNTVRVDLGPQGQLRQYDFPSKSTDEKEEEAIARVVETQNVADIAIRFLTLYTQIDTANAELVTRETKEDPGTGSVEHTLVFQVKHSAYPDLSDKYSIIVSGEKINDFSWSVTHPDNDETTMGKVISITFNILLALAWATVGIYALIAFFSKTRKTQLDFVKTWRVGLFTMLIFIAMIYAQGDDWDDVVFGGGIGGSFIALFAIMAYSIGESVTRETWKEKLVSIDAMFTGNLRVKEFGNSLVKGIGLAGAGFLIFNISIWLFSFFPGTILEIPSGTIDLSSPLKAFFSNMFTYIFLTIWLSIIFFLIWGSFIRRKIKSKVAGVSVITLFLAFAGYELASIDQPYVSILAIAPVAFLWAQAYQKEEFLTIFSSLVFAFILLGVQTFLITGSSSVTLFAAVSIGFLLLVYIVGVIVRRIGVPASTFAEYVPEYMLNQEERERIENELAIAKKVQIELLPQTTPDYKQVSIETICIPALEVGGDYFDFFPYDENRLGLIIGDVSGKGVPAAFYMTLVKGIIRTLVLNKESPKVILDKLNKLFYENTPRNVFISAIYGILDFEKKELCFSRAGHVPLLIRKEKTGEFNHLTPNGIALGLDEGRRFKLNLEEQCVPIDSGDTLLFYTDGISEAANKNGDEFGDDRLADIIEKYDQKGPKKVLEEVEKAIEDFEEGARRHDDITAVAVKVNELS